MAFVRTFTLVNLAIGLLAVPAVAQDSTPQVINVQGFLSDKSSGTPVPANGTFSIQFGLYDAELDGLLIRSLGPLSVAATTGLYSVELPFVSTDFDGTERYLEIVVEGEVLTPRLRVTSTPFAYMAESVDGYEGSDLEESTEISTGDAVLQGQVDDLQSQIDDIAITGGNTLDEAYDEGGPGAGRIITTDAGGVYFAGPGGLQSQGPIKAQSPTNSITTGVIGNGSFAGGYFADADFTAWAYIGNGGFGVNASGDLIGITATGATGGVFTGTDLGIDASGNTAGQFSGGFRGLQASGGTGAKLTGTVDFGVEADGERIGVLGRGFEKGGYFFNLETSSRASIGTSGYGIRAEGSYGGGRFENQSGSSSAEIATGDYGIWAEGTVAGGHFNTVEVVDRTTTGVLEITGGADVAEPFPIISQEASLGSLVVIDEDIEGTLRVSDTTYDRRVAGIISGAGGIKPGLTLSQEQPMENSRNVAMAGRVFALATTANGPIRPGDLLTTSSVPGHAMKATDMTRAPGAVVGKAMSALESGQGLVLVLVNLH